MIQGSKPYSKSIGLVTDPIVAIKRTVKVMPGEEVTLDLIISIAEDAASYLQQKYENSNVIENTFELAKAKAEAENIYLGLKSADTLEYQKMLSYLMFINPMKSLETVEKGTYSQSELWKYGISGDIPIIFIEIKDANDIHVIYDILKAHEFFRAKNVEVDLVILNTEPGNYEQYTKYEIENAILNSQSAYLRNKTGGIFVINKSDIPKEDIELLKLRANLVLNAENGKIGTQIEDLEEEYLETISNIGADFVGTDQCVGPEGHIDPSLQLYDEDLSHLKYYNEYGGFSEDGLEYCIKFNRNNRLPTVWSMILANEKFGTIVTQNLGGYTWKESSRLNRISSWNNNPLIDVPSEIIYIKDRDTGVLWSLSENINNEVQDYYLTYGFGYAKLKTISNNILQELEIFVPKEDGIKVNILKLKNLSGIKKRLKLVYYVKPVMRGR